MRHCSLGNSKIARKTINLTFKASIADLNVAPFHLLLVQQTICELMKDLLIVRQLKSRRKGEDVGCNYSLHAGNVYVTVVLNFTLINSDGQKSWRSHDFLVVP